jgi:hypothetical protein
MAITRTKMGKQLSAPPMKKPKKKGKDKKRQPKIGGKGKNGKSRRT